MGSLARVNVFYQELKPYLSNISENMEIFAAVLGGTSVHEINVPYKAALIIGSESHGITDDLLQVVKNKISIPSFSLEKNSAESLNASIAAAILCNEFRRKLNK